MDDRMAEDETSTSPATPSTTNLLSIPDEVIYGSICFYLGQNDLLRLRRTCQKMKPICDDYFRRHYGRIDREIVINESDCTFDHYLSMGFYFRRVRLKNTDKQFFEHPRIPEFLEHFAAEITHLRVENFYACVPQREDNFYLALTNLQHLEIDYIHTFGTTCFTMNEFEKGKFSPHSSCYIPATFRNLQTLKLGDLVMSDDDEGDEGYAGDFMKYCTELEYLRHPLNDVSEIGFDIMVERMRDLNSNPNKPIRLKYYDIEFVRDRDDIFDTVGFHFPILLALCENLNVKLLNVQSRLFQLLSNLQSILPDSIVDPIVSTKNVHGYMFLNEFPNLEEVIITSTQSSSVKINDENEAGTIQWPKLKVLDVTIDSKYTANHDEILPVNTEELLDFLFAQVARPALRDLRVRFSDDFPPRKRKTILPCPRTADIVNHCGNVTKLTLTNWLGANDAVSIFWGGLPHLEEVTLDKCKLLGDGAFVGAENEDPVFLKLKKLKKVTLSCLDVMPNLTDQIFDLVFRHLQIKQFYLTSATPVKSITASGIRSLLTSNFDKCVEKFPFAGWSLDKVSEEEFNQLKSEFRASHML